MIFTTTKGAIFLSQLEYVIGKENVEKTLKKYFDDFKFKHPTPNDIKRTAEKVSGIDDWFCQAFDSIEKSKKGSDAQRPETLCWN